MCPNGLLSLLHIIYVCRDCAAVKDLLPETLQHKQQVHQDLTRGAIILYIMYNIPHSMQNTIQINTCINNGFVLSGFMQ